MSYTVRATFRTQVLASRVVSFCGYTVLPIAGLSFRDDSESHFREPNTVRVFSVRIVKRNRSCIALTSAPDTVLEKKRGPIAKHKTSN